MRKRAILLAAAFVPMLFSMGEADDGIWQPLNRAYYMNRVQGIDIGYTTSLDKCHPVASGLRLP